MFYTSFLFNLATPFSTMFPSTAKFLNDIVIANTYRSYLVLRVL